MYGLSSPSIVGEIRACLCDAHSVQVKLYVKDKEEGEVVFGAIVKYK